MYSQDRELVPGSGIENESVTGSARVSGYIRTADKQSCRIGYVAVLRGDDALPGGVPKLQLPIAIQGHNLARSGERQSRDGDFPFERDGASGVRSRRNQALDVNSGCDDPRCFSRVAQNGIDRLHTGGGHRERDAALADELPAVAFPDSDFQAGIVFRKTHQVAGW